MSVVFLNDQVGGLGWQPGSLSRGLFSSVLDWDPRGFDQERDLESMVKQVSQRGGRVVATLAAQQKTVEDGSYGESLTHFCDRIQSHLKKTGTV